MESVVMKKQYQKPLPGIDYSLASSNPIVLLTTVMVPPQSYRRGFTKVKGQQSCKFVVIGTISFYKLT
jgi:hypothetical protein